MDIQKLDTSYGFCIEGKFTPICKDLVFYEFPDEKEIIVLLLAYFKEFLPQTLSKKLDYYKNPIHIDSKDIDLISRKDFGKYVVVISITDDNSSYPDENFVEENSDYTFQIDLQVQADDMLASHENLIKLKSAVKTLLVNMDHNLGLTTAIEGFSYGNFGIDETNRYVQQGIYRFSVQGYNFKK